MSATVKDEFHVREVSGLKLDSKTGYLGGIFVVFTVPPPKITLRLLPSTSLLINLMNLITDSVVE